MNEYKVTIKVQNNYMFTAMKAKGINTAAELSRLCGVDQSKIGQFLNLKRTPFNKFTGEYLPSIIAISEALGVIIEALFPLDHLYTPLKKNKASIELSKTELLAITEQKEPQFLLEETAQSEAITEVLNSLSWREREVLKMRFGLNGEAKTFDEIGKKFDVTRERIRQIEAKALRRLRHPRSTTVLNMERKEIQSLEEYKEENPPLKEYISR